MFLRALPGSHNWPADKKTDPGKESNALTKLKRFDPKKYVIIANISNGVEDKLITLPEIRDIKQLYGKTVGIPRNDYTSLTVLNGLLTKNGLTVDAGNSGIKIRMGKTNEILGDFRAGKIDAIMGKFYFWNPKSTILNGLDKTADELAPTKQVLLVRKDFLKKHPDVVNQVLQAQIEVTGWANQHKLEALELIWMNSEKYYLENALPTAKPPKSVMDQNYRKTAVSVYPNLQFMNEVWKNTKTYNPDIYSLKNFVNFSPLNKVLRKNKKVSIQQYNRTHYKNR